MTDPIRFNIVNAEPATKAEKPPVDVRLASEGSALQVQYKNHLDGWMVLVEFRKDGTMRRWSGASDGGVSGFQFDSGGRIRLKGEGEA